MREILIGTKKYTVVLATDEKEFNANHRFEVYSNPSATDKPARLGVINFQKGPIKEAGVNGVMNEDVIAMVIDRLCSFQESPFKCRENAMAIAKLEEALMWLGKRTQDRERRQVEGTHIV